MMFPRHLPPRAPRANDYSGLEVLAGAVIGFFSFLTGGLGWYGISKSRGRSSGLWWLAPIVIVTLTTIPSLIYFIEEYSDGEGLELRFFSLFVLCCILPWVISAWLIQQWKKARKRRGSGSSSHLL